MNNFYTFIITSTINASIGVFSSDERYKQTLESIQSIRDKVTNSKIVFMDNSNEPLSEEWISNISKQVDVLITPMPNIFTRFANNIGSKGVGEAYMISEIMKAIEEKNLIGKRIFKMSGRYKLAESFNIEEYEDLKYIEKYAFRINPWEVSSPSGQWEGNRLVWYFETRLYSFCPTLFEEYKGVVEKCFHTMLTEYGNLMCNWEMNHWQHVPHEKVLRMEPIHVEGLNAENGVYRFE